jgi:hypothetical protein
MPDEESTEVESTYYDEIRADVETAVYAYATLEEIDVQMQAKSLQTAIRKAKQDCIIIMCKGLEMIREGYDEDE